MKFGSKKNDEKYKDAMKKLALPEELTELQKVVAVDKKMTGTVYLKDGSAYIISNGRLIKKR